MSKFRFADSHWVWRGLFCYALLLSFYFPDNDGRSEEGGQSQPFQTGSREAQVQVRVQRPSVLEARQRSKILYETVHGVLQVMHRDFFERDEGLKIPSHSLEDVFKELERQYDVKMRWLAVDAQAMNIDHKPKTDFELAAVRAIQNGKSEYESIGLESYQFVGRVRLSATCLSCHAPKRSSNDDRSAGLLIAFPIAKQDDERGP